MDDASAPGPAPADQRASAASARPTRIQQRNREAIVAAALSVFAESGFRGATLDRIAAAAALSKPNLLYYYPSKHAIYVAVLEGTLAAWLEPLAALDPDGDPLAEIARYVEAKLAMAERRPEESRLFANEVLHGAPAIADFLAGPLKRLVDEKAAVLTHWIAEGRLRPVDPRHLIMMIWAMTQHYADFDAQVRAVLGRDDPDRFAEARRTMLAVLLEGLRPPRAS